jgi:hypothetical protein
MSSSETDVSYEVQEISGKAKGLVARCDIDNGKQMISEKPLFTTPSMSSIGLIEHGIAAKLTALLNIEQRHFLSLHNNFPGKHPFTGIVKSAPSLAVQTLLSGEFTLLFALSSQLSSEFLQ